MNPGIVVALIALLSPLVTGSVTAVSIAVERRRTEHDLEVRRQRLVDMARNQIAAVQPLLTPADDHGVEVEEDSRDRAHAIVASALDLILRAQALAQLDDHLQQRAANAMERSNSLLGELFLRRALHSPGARFLRFVYYVVFGWGGLGLIGLCTVVFDRSGRDTVTSVVPSIVFAFILTGVIPVWILRSMVLSCERRYLRRKRDREDAAPPPPAPPPSNPSDYSSYATAPNPGYYGSPAYDHSQILSQTPTLG
jgi:hypothetical protein